MFSLNSLAIFSTIAFSALTSALPLNTPVGDLSVPDVPAVPGIAPNIAGVVTRLGSRDVPPGIAAILEHQVMPCVRPAAVAISTSIPLSQCLTSSPLTMLPESGTAQDVQVEAGKMQNCLSSSIASLHALRGQPMDVILAPPDGTDAPLSPAQLAVSIGDLLTVRPPSLSLQCWNIRESDFGCLQAVVTAVNELTAFGSDTVMSLTDSIGPLLTALLDLLGPTGPSPPSLQFSSLSST